MTDMQQVGRIALRQEGEFWNAYYAKTETMDDAIMLGSIRLSTVLENPERKQAFMTLMRSVVSEILEGSTGLVPEWREPTSAPEHERAGHS